MSHTGSGRAGAGLIIGLVVLLSAAAGTWLLLQREPAPSVAVTPATVPAATRPLSQPTTTPAPPPPTSYMDVVLATQPEFPTTQPLSLPLPLDEAARLILKDPIYLDPVGEIWITRPDAEPIRQVFEKAKKQSTHVLREHVVFVHRWPDVKGVWQPHLIVRKEGADDAFEMVTAAGRIDIGDRQGYRFDRAFSWNDKFVVPTATGVSVFRPEQRPMELHHDFAEPATQPTARPATQESAASQAATSGWAEPQFLLDWRGLIAWIPWENGNSGSRGAARFLNDQWTRLDGSQGWPEKILHLVPLLDGGVLQLIVDDQGMTLVRMAKLDVEPVDPKPIEQLVAKLADPDPRTREQAFDQLTRYGEGSWSVLERLRPQQPPEAQRRIDRLLRAKLRPTLGRMLLQPGPTRVVARLRDGGALLLAEQGVVVANPGAVDGDPSVLIPAWIAIRAGRPIEPAPPGLVADFDPQQHAITTLGGDWIVTDWVYGPRLWQGNHFQPLLPRKFRQQYQHVVGMDRQGRWLFRTSPQAPETLVLDPRLPDATPRLPVWWYPVEGGSVGWTEEGWPVTKRGGAWVLTEKAWKPLDESKSRMLTHLPDPSDVAPATTPSTVTSLPAIDPALGEPILIEKDGTRYFGGRESLTVLRPDGRQLTWTLPPEATGAGDVWLVAAGDGNDRRLFLFNEPGRALRLRETGNASEPFRLEATFTDRIPATDYVTRIWLDPAGRINITWDKDKLAILFPSGRIPPEIRKMMPASELQEAEEEQE